MRVVFLLTILFSILLGAPEVSLADCEVDGNCPPPATTPTGGAPTEAPLPNPAPRPTTDPAPNPGTTNNPGPVTPTPAPGATGGEAALTGDPGGLVPCSGRDCGTCQLITLGNRVLVFFIKIILAGIPVLFAIAGFWLTMSKGNMSEYQRAKGMLQNVIIGLILVLVGWLIVDTMLKALLANNGQVNLDGASMWGPWNQIPESACTTQNPLADRSTITTPGDVWEGVADLDDGTNTRPNVEIEGAVVTNDSVCFPGDSTSGQVCFKKVDVPNTDDYKYADASAFGYTRPGYFIDLNTVDPDTPLSPNFTVGEYAQLYKGRYAYIDPEMPGRLEAVRSNLGNEPVIINSGYRSPGYNSTLEGAAEHSRHQYGDAVDIRLNGRSASEVRASCRASGATFCKTYTAHVHCDWRTTNAPNNC